ncbi:hypothetical protein FA13DRAFT_723524 [Coprinellus micaceus]|uniref:BTB domain-containing protein n=1 Tax=Coprinellus micaceus TaxID=71717 RepID=A0A4Y7TVU4_COPMI|nr:hypothetical protein FA13DRAFT_723524 [Coprinellus micaceus]
MPDAREGRNSREMKSTAKKAALNDEVYYWPDNVRFLVQGVLFRVPRLPFILGSRYFTEKHELRSNGVEAEPVIHLQSVSAPQFRVFLKFLFPMPSNKPLESIFTKYEWITILSLCTAWHFPEFRKLAIQNLDGKLAELELIYVGRALSIPIFVLEGYRAIINRPKAQIITKEESAAIGHEVELGRELHESFAEELAELERYDEERRADPEGNSKWEDVGGGGGDKGEAPPGTAGPAMAQAAEETKGDNGTPPEPPAPVHSSNLPEPPAGLGGRDRTQNSAGKWPASDREQEPPASYPEQGDVTQDDAEQRGMDDGEADPEPEQVQLATALENLKEEERGIVEQLRDLKSRRLTLDATEKLEGVETARRERIEEELREIAEVKLAAEQLTRELETANEWDALDLQDRLEDAKDKRAELERQSAEREKKEHGQIVRWNKVGKKHKEKALAKLGAELLECQIKQKETVERLKQLGGMRDVSPSDSIGKEGADAGREDAESSTAAEQDDPRVAERRRKISEELERVRKAKEVQLQKETKLRMLEEDYSKKLSKVERLLSQPSSCLPKTTQKRERKRDDRAKNLSKTQTELKEVLRMLGALGAEEGKLENELRLL